MTKIKLTNQNTEDVVTYITLGATNGCILDVTKIIFSDNTKINEVSKLMGHFVLKGNTSVYLEAPNGEGFNGNVSFNTPPMNCKSKELPNGMNVAEFIVNNGFQDGLPQETIDNSCVAGANAKIKFSVDTDDWTSNGGTIKVSEFQNNSWDKNTDVVDSLMVVITVQKVFHHQNVLVNNHSLLVHNKFVMYKEVQIIIRVVHLK
jgi:hypothetical protein